MDMLDLPDKEIVTTTATVLNACRAAYKKGLIDAAKDFCFGCEDLGVPIRGASSSKWIHGHAVCLAPRIWDRVGAAGGWNPEGT